MNKLNLFVFIILITCLCHKAKGQNKKYIVGLEGWGNIDQTKPQDDVSNYRTDLNAKLYAGKFINKNTVVYAFFGVDYLGFLYSGATTHPTKGEGKSRVREYYITPQLGLGIRKYFSFTDANKVGLLIDVETDYGLPTRRFKAKSEFSSETLNVQVTEHAKEISFITNIGVYYNINTNWQFIFRIGGLHYHYLWDYDEKQIIGVTPIPQKGRRMGLAFNASSFRLSFARLL